MIVSEGAVITALIVMEIEISVPSRRRLWSLMRCHQLFIYPPGLEETAAPSYLRTSLNYSLHKSPLSAGRVQRLNWPVGNTPQNKISPVLLFIQLVGVKMIYFGDQPSLQYNNKI